MWWNWIDMDTIFLERVTVTKFWSSSRINFNRFPAMYGRLSNQDFRMVLIPLEQLSIVERTKVNKLEFIAFKNKTKIDNYLYVWIFLFLVLKISIPPTSTPPPAHITAKYQLTSYKVGYEIKIRKPVTFSNLGGGGKQLFVMLKRSSGDGGSSGNRATRRWAR